MASEDYSADSIVVLSGLECVRKRPGMYVGDVNSSLGVHHLVYQALSDIIEHARTGWCTWVSVEIRRDGSCVIEHDGRPVGDVADPTKALEDQSSVLVTDGLFAALPVVRALCTEFVLTAWDRGDRHERRYADSEPAGDWVTRRDDHWPGLRVQFRPDPALLGDFELEFTRLRNRLRTSTSMLAGFRSSIADRRTGEGAEFCFPNGLADRIVETVRGRSLASPKPLHITAEQGDWRVEAAVLWCVDDDFGAQLATGRQVVSWVNTVQTRNDGTHVDGFLRAVAVAEKGLDLRRPHSPLVMLSLFMPWPRYSAPVKDRLESEEATDFVYEHVLGPLREQWAEGSELVAALRRV